MSRLVIISIGFFLPAPFFSVDVLSALRHRDRLMRGLCAYDLVRPQTDDSLRAFLGYTAAVAGGRHREDGSFIAWSYRSRAARFPVGIDTPASAALDSLIGKHPERRNVAGARP
ncbi:MAG TPA: trehalose-6-phosphate synthase [Stellaceae bacterium]|nr:trehalose-6-phosphate synthase [Stellaceae bacterium]